MALKTWTIAEEQYLKEHYATISNPRDLLLHIPKTYKAIKTKAKKLGLKRAVVTPSQNTDTPEMLAYIRTHYLSTSISRMAVDLSKSETYVKAALKRHKLVQPRKLIEQFKLDSQIKKGNIPQNKGRKQTEYMTAEAIQRTLATRFRKGQKSPCEEYDGALSFRMDKTGRPYVYIRLAKSKWVLFQVYVWECTHGPVPKGYCVSFKNGESMDCRPGNLELITRKENMLRNSASKNLSDGYIANCLAWRNKPLAQELLKQPQLIELKRESLLLKRTMYEQQKEIS